MKRRVKNIIFYPNGNVAMTDEADQQITELQAGNILIDAIRAKGFDIPEDGVTIMAPNTVKVRPQ